MIESLKIKFLSCTEVLMKGILNGGREIEEDRNKKPSLSWVFWFTTVLAYNWIELETFCLEPSGSSMQPAKPTIISVRAKRDKTFFIM